MPKDTVGKAPAFRFYPSDFWGSPDVQAMDMHEVGAYLALLSTAWLGDRYGVLPDDDEKLRRWSRLSREQWAQSREILLSKFPVMESGWRSNPRLVTEAEKMEAYSASRSANGKKGGRPKKHVVLFGNHMQSTAQSIDESIEKLSVSVSGSVSKKQKPPRDAQVFVLPEWIDPMAWEGHQEVRRKKRAASTPYALRLLLQELSKMRDKGLDPNEALRKSARSGWTDVFEPANGHKAGVAQSAIKYSDPEAMNAR